MVSYKLSINYRKDNFYWCWLCVLDEAANKASENHPEELVAAEVINSY